ncbi:TetR/AcrR family transcriptional regulator [Brachybacterium conglomeratum]|uniref:TetR/AcrR family transcriptional regulator n=1 Tax=Brachybacterium conglomeratum TaxID=47846 RepID=UPI003D9FE038
MPHSLSVTVHVDLDLHEVVLSIAGCLTARTYDSVLPVVAQARGLEPAPRLTLDLLDMQHIDVDGLLPLRQAIELADPEQKVPLSIKAPETLPLCPLSAATPRADGSDSPPLRLHRRADAPATEGSDDSRRLASAAASPTILTERARRGIAPRSRREEILAGAAEMFAEHGYHGASLRDIAGHIGISHPGLMHHFPSKDSLLHTVIDSLEDRTQRTLEEVERLSVEPEALMQELAATWHPGALHVRLLATLAAESVSGDHPGRFRMARLRRVHENIFEQCFTAYGERGLLRRGVDPGFAGRALLGLVLNLAVREKTVRAMQGPTHDDGPVQELARMMRSFLSKDAVG